MTKAIDLTTLMNTRLCHDITGPISAINNGVELLEEMGDDPAMREEAMTLILSSAKEAAYRLQFYRLAFGHLSSSEDATLLSRRSVIENFFAATKANVHFPDSMRPISQSLIRLCFNLLIIANQCLIRGGDIHLQETEDGAISIKAAGASVRLNPSYIEALNGHTAVGASDPKTIHLTLIREMLQDAPAKLEVSVKEDDCFEATIKALPQEGQ